MNREDVLIELFSISPLGVKDDAICMDESIESINVDETIITTPYLHVLNHTIGKQTSDGRLGSYVEVDILTPNTAATAASSNSSSNNNEAPTVSSVVSSDKVIVITTPEKFNITCQLHQGDISIEHGNKLEGDVHLSTMFGNIDIGCKVRGYEVTLSTMMTDDTLPSSSSTTLIDKGNIYVRKVIEAKTLNICSSSRVRARMLNVGSKLSIVSTTTATTTSVTDALSSSLAADSQENNNTYTKLDDDDEGAVIDIGSIYIVTSGLGMDDNDARLIVSDESSNHHNNRGLVRVKSSHGHIVIHAKTNRMNYLTPPITISKSSDSTITPLIDLGGVNGSCDVLLEGVLSSSSSSYDSVNTKQQHYVGPPSSTTPPTMRVHFDALSPESISTITSRGILLHQSINDDYNNNISSLTSITMDRKLESEIRLLSTSEYTTVDAHDITSEDVHDVNNTLLTIAKEKTMPLILGDSEQQEHPLISIETDAYIDGEYDSLDEGVEQTSKSPHHGGMLQYMQGTMSNRSGEPDARSDMRGKGKINIDGAALQALQGFQSGKKQSPSSSSSSVLLPLLAVATDGGIKLETLSWFGSIARRYGLDATEADGKKDELLGSLGRQARRVPRLEK
jgi:hypothetical protein